MHNELKHKPNHKAQGARALDIEGMASRGGSIVISQHSYFYFSNVLEYDLFFIRVFKLVF